MKITKITKTVNNKPCERTEFIGLNTQGEKKKPMKLEQLTERRPRSGKRNNK